MPVRDRAIDRAHRLARRAGSDLGAEFRHRRVVAGLSQARVAQAAGLSRSVLGRIERGEQRNLRTTDLWTVATVLGLDLRLNAYPGGQPIHDHVQPRLLAAIRARTAAGRPWLHEVPLPVEGDRRAWDAVWVGPDGWTAFEAVSRLGAVDATVRTVRQKQRDDPRVVRVILVVADTRRNREALAAARQLLVTEFPLGGRDILAELARGRMPPADGVIVLRVPAHRGTA